MTKKTALSLTETRVAAGVWEGVLSATDRAAPVIEARHGDRVIDGVEVQAVPGKAGQFVLRVPIPAWALNSGLQSFGIWSGEVMLAQFSVVAGQPQDDDLRAEVNLLRAEVELLKRAFRRHCLETGG